MIRKNNHKNLAVITLGILMPIFLFGIFLNNSKAGDEQLVKIIFALKNPTQVGSFLSTHKFDVKQLFSGIYSATTTPEILQSLKTDPEVDYVEPDVEVSATLVSTNDTYFTTDSKVLDKQWYLPKTRVPDAWDFSEGSSQVVVAIVDTGIHASHTELKDGRVIAGYNSITESVIEANTDSDDNGHGTAVAGVIGATPNNNRGIAGINWNVKIMPIKALSGSGTGGISDVASGIVWAADHGANIINLSLGGASFQANQTLAKAVTHAYNKGVLIVAAAGNDLADSGLNLDDSPVYPVCSDNGFNMVLGVTATDINDKKADFANYGGNCIDIAAPGKRILTSAFLPSNPSNNVLIYGSGTSLAAPIVSGIAALIKASNPDLSNVEIRNILMDNADNIDSQNLNKCSNFSCAGLLGKGRVNAYTYYAPKPITSGSFVRDVNANIIYLISGSKKIPVSDFVFAQRGYDPGSIIDDNNGLLDTYVLGQRLPPLEGTLIKDSNNPIIYIINNQLKLPVTYTVFISRNFSFTNVQTLDKKEVQSYRSGNWYWPADNTAIVVADNPLVYVMEAQVARPVSYFTFVNRKFSFAKVLKISSEDFFHLPKAADNYWLAPLDGTLVKATDADAIYLIENGVRRLLSQQAFTSRKYLIANVKVLSQAEVDVIARGNPVLE